VLNVQDETDASANDNLRDGFNTRFSVLERNIRSLVQGVSAGTIRRSQSSQLTFDLLNQAEKSKEELLSLVRDQGASAAAFYRQTKAAFGNVYQNDNADDAVSNKITDGRRINPLDEPAFHMLVSDYQKETIDGMPFLRYTLTGGNDGMTTLLPLDAHGNLIFRRPPLSAFASLTLQDFVDYAADDEALYKLLTQAEANSYFTELDSQSYPNYLYEYAESLREALLSMAPNASADDKAQARQRWIDARKAYFASVESFLTGSSQKDLIAKYDSLIAASGQPSRSADLASLRNAAVSDFSILL
jgi:hypothetical protein